MKVLCLLLLSVFYSCKGGQVAPVKVDKKSKEKKSTKFKSLIDSSNVQGSVLIYDPQLDLYYSNDYIWAKKRNLPASTFKIVNSIIAIETEIVENDSTLFKWDGESRGVQGWEQDLIFKEAFHYSCVPCFQEIAKKIGPETMNYYLDKFNYGLMVVDSNNVDLFWLEGESKISQIEQIDFLKRFYYSKLPISNRTESLIKEMMVIDRNDNYKLTGKTGWSIRNGHNNAWFVGYLEVKEKVFFFATNIEPTGIFNRAEFLRLRKEVTFDFLKKISII